MMSEGALNFVIDPDGNIGLASPNGDGNGKLTTVNYGPNKQEIIWSAHSVRPAKQEEVLARLSEQAEEPKSKPTPPPWGVCVSDGDVWIEPSGGSLNGGYLIGEMSGPDAEANASLIVSLVNKAGSSIGSFKPIPEDKSDLDGRQVMIFGPSGYVEPNHMHIETGHWDAERNGWYNDAHDRISESWPQPTHYAELGDIEKVAKR